MELRAFAERVLFGSTLEDKLCGADVITDAHPGTAWSAPTAPVRPPELRFKPLGGGKADFPSLQHLAHPRERGRLLHYFANHELLATELMALALLRFPDAPSAFRRGLLHTLQDEQAHTRLYLERMRACGIEFGEFPVSGFFWRAVSGMQSPMDYVAGLSLTFEQANLDYCHHFAREFRTIGDEATARLLEGIYRDEIQHVAYGLTWFRRWKDPKLNDWGAFCRQLKFPLSPSRAKGVGWNVDGRRAAGLEPTFIAELDVHSQSKGRTPTVFVFNPFVERSIAAGPSFTPVQEQAQMAADLQNLPQFLARRDDIVLVKKRPSVEFLSSLKQAGFPLPEFVELKDGKLDPASALAGRRLGRLRPWAWGPDSLELFARLFPNVTGEERTPERRFNAGIAELYSKTWSAQFLRRVLEQEQEPERTREWLCGRDDVGIAVATIDEALAAINAIRARGHIEVVAKEALGLAGQSMIRMLTPNLLENEQRWMVRALEHGQKLIIEPWYRFRADFSVQMEMQPQGLKICGYTGLRNDRRGQFEANWAAGNYRHVPPMHWRQLFPQVEDPTAAIRQLYENIRQLLETELRARGFLGPVGIDAFFYGSSGKDLWRLKPIVEINPRYTMGRLTLELMRYTCPGSLGQFRLVSRKQAAALGGFVGYAQEMARSIPLCFGGQPVSRLAQGVVCLNDPAGVEQRLALFEVHARSFHDDARADQVPR